MYRGFILYYCFYRAYLGTTEVCTRMIGSIVEDVGVPP